ncbi:hypothetical protein H632_c105p2 [Helicosporidium sp. ATCC 50920]|nr:hypothetical protein H632_c105p2 [Helicosporidium sp. ATCC 50920]|eukprot:KDD76788.1 hypothetical protein H632_c105p2 [Helicosporidium sp. ATCC 50920]
MVNDGGTSMAGIAAGGAHTCAIYPDKSSSLMCWGDNTYGQMGVNFVGGNSNVPQAVVDIPGYGPGEWLFVATGTFNTCGTITATGTFCWGAASYGANGNDNLVNNMLMPYQMVLAEAAPIGIAGKYNTFYAWNAEGVLFAWGDNSSGQTGLLDAPAIVAVATAVEITGVKAIAPGKDFGLALQTNNNIFSFGSNDSGQLGIASTAAVNGPQQVAGQWTSIGAGGSVAYAVGAL